MASNYARVLVNYSSNPVRKKTVDIELENEVSHLVQLQKKFLDIVKEDGSIHGIYGATFSTQPEDLIFLIRDTIVNEDVEVTNRECFQNGNVFTVMVNLNDLSFLNSSGFNSGKISLFFS